MKILKIENGKALFVTNNKVEEYKSIKEIEKEDILRFLRLIYNNDDCEMDKCDENHIIMNPAEELIYKNLYEQFKKFNDDKETLKEKINEELEKAESKYTQ